MSTKAHPYHPSCGCWLCCEVEEAEERAEELAAESVPPDATEAPQLHPVFAGLLSPWSRAA